MSDWVVRQDLKPSQLITGCMIIAPGENRTLTHTFLRDFDASHQ